MSIRISVLVSGGGSNLQALIDAQEAGLLGDGKIVQVISGKADAYALQRAANHDIPSIVIDKIRFPNEKDRNAAILSALHATSTDLVVLAGYMNVLGPEVISSYRNRIVNIHPALIPKFCGKGMYGTHVHRAVLAAEEKETGATVHMVDEGVDTGPILKQERIPVLPGDTAETLASRVLEIEHIILPAAVGQLVAEIERKK
jgi:phosphoribosylglycinamide formyltransferase 1